MRANRAYCCLPCRDVTRLRARRRQLGMGSDMSYGAMFRNYETRPPADVEAEIMQSVREMRASRIEEAKSATCFGCENKIGSLCVHFADERASFLLRHAIEGEKKPLTRDVMVAYIDELFKARAGKDMPLPDLVLIALTGDRVGVVPDDQLRIANCAPAEPWIAALAAKATLHSITSRAPDGELLELRIAEAALSQFLSACSEERTEAN